MSEKLKESLSAVIDGEADEFELRRVLDEVGKDAELQQSWDRYHLIGSVMRREQVARFHAMRERVWTELQGDDPVLVTESSQDEAESMPVRTGRWRTFGVAAGLVIAVAVGYVQLGEFGQDSGPVIAANDEAPAQSETIEPRPVQTAGLTSEVSRNDRNRTDGYRIYHYQQLGMNQSGFGGFTRMVSYERR